MQQRNIVLLCAVTACALLLAGYAIAEFQGTMGLKAGDEVYACDCGEGCPCLSMSNNAGQCTCGKDLVKAKVVKVDGDMAHVKAEGWDKEREFKMTGQYMCACPPGCPCDTVGQNPGKCTCGKEMKKVGS